MSLEQITMLSLTAKVIVTEHCLFLAEISIIVIITVITIVFKE